MKVGLVASSGGHLAHLAWLEPWWREHERFWVTFDTPDAIARLDGERVWWAHHPTNRSPSALVRNTRLAADVLWRERPDLLVSSGAAVAVPFLSLSALLGIPTIFVEVVDRIDAPSLTARLVGPFVDALVLTDVRQRAGLPHGRLLETR